MQGEYWWVLILWQYSENIQSYFFTNMIIVGTQEYWLDVLSGCCDLSTSCRPYWLFVMQSMQKSVLFLLLESLHVTPTSLLTYIWIHLTASKLVLSFVQVCNDDRSETLGIRVTFDPLPLFSCLFTGLLLQFTFQQREHISTVCFFLSGSGWELEPNTWEGM